MESLHIDSFGWADTSVDWNMSSRKKYLESTSRRVFSRAKTSFATSIIRFGNNAGYKAGGCTTSTTRKWASKCTPTSLVDPSGMGRWSGLEFFGSGGRRLSFLTVYRSVRASDKQTSTYHSQQVAILSSKGYSSPNPRRQCLSDLSDFIQPIIDDPLHEIVVCIDANESLHTKSSAIRDFMEGSNLFDLHSGLHDSPSSPVWTYHDDHHSSRIDFMFGFLHTYEALSRAGYTLPDRHPL